jgi:hypothetical protein
MTYRTHSLPDWQGIDPHPTDDDPEYVQEAARTLKDIFGENQDTHRPEFDAPKFAKPMLVRAARVLADQTEDQTLRELCEVLPWADAEDVSDDDPNPRVTPEVLAVAVYSEVVWSREWGADQLGDEWDDSIFVTVHDGVRDLAELAKEEA